MNQINLFTGGHPFRLNEFKWMQDGILDAFVGISTALGVNYKLSGSQVTVSATADTTAGYIVLNGEVLKVDAHSIVIVGGQTLYWSVEETYPVFNPTDPVTYSDSMPYNVHAIRRGKLAYSASPPAGTEESNMAEFNDLIDALAVRASSSQVNAGTGGNKLVTSGDLGALDNIAKKNTTNLFVQRNVFNQGYNTENDVYYFREKVLFGNWDMDNDDNILIAHGLTSLESDQIVSVCAIIESQITGARIVVGSGTFSENGSYSTSDISDMAISTINSSGIRLVRQNSGSFDGPNLNNTDVTVYIKWYYIPSGGGL